MKIYIAHSREFDYVNELYIPIRNDEHLNEYTIVLPHEKSAVSSNTRDFYKNIDLLIAECSYSSIGLGIELGWAFDDNVPIYCIYQKGKKISSSIYSVSNNVYEYENIDSMLKLVENIIDIEKNKKIITKK